MCEIKYRVERKEYLFGSLREPGSPAESPGGGEVGKVRPGAKCAKKVINESGTAAKTASYAHGGYRGCFLFAAAIPPVTAKGGDSFPPGEAKAASPQI